MQHVAIEGKTEFLEQLQEKLSKRLPEDKVKRITAFAEDLYATAPFEEAADRQGRGRRPGQGKGGRLGSGCLPGRRIQGAVPFRTHGLHGAQQSFLRLSMEDDLQKNRRTLCCRDNRR